MDGVMFVVMVMVGGKMENIQTGRLYLIMTVPNRYLNRCRMKYMQEQKYQVETRAKHILNRQIYYIITIKMD